MAAMIALRPKDDRGVEIIVELEARTEMKPMEAIEDDIRRYYPSAEDGGLDAFNPMLDKIDADWSDHVETFRGNRRYPPATDRLKYYRLGGVKDQRPLTPT